MTRIRQNFGPTIVLSRKQIAAERKEYRSARRSLNASWREYKAAQRRTQSAEKTFGFDHPRTQQLWDIEIDIYSRGADLNHEVNCGCYVWPPYRQEGDCND